MHNQSKREELIQYTNRLIEQNNDKIKVLNEQMHNEKDEKSKKIVMNEIEDVKQFNRRLSLRLQEPVQGMILEIYRLRELRKAEPDKNKKTEMANQIHELQDKIRICEFGGDKNIGRFNSFK